MNKFNVSAPRFDRLLQVAVSQPIVIKDRDKQALMQIYERLKVLSADADHDYYRHFWFYINRGTIRNFGSFEEYRYADIINTRKDFKNLWLCDYPEEKHWYHFETNEYNGEYYFYIDGKLTFQISKNKPDYYETINNSQLLKILNNIVNVYCQWIVDDNADYNEFLNQNLSYHRRLGKILRQKYWKIDSDEKKEITEGLKAKDMKLLQKIVEQSADDYCLSPMKTMTSGKFFEYCRMGYDANNYFETKPDISNLDAYSAFADGRDEGLRKLNPDSEKDFRHWFFDRGRGGGHPWEVCSGGNSTHISLYVQYEHKENGWTLQLGGSSSMRVNETVKFALALYKNRIPFKLSYASEILDMVTGKDYIGIVPHEISPQYCHSLFPDDERIIDFMNLEWEKKEKIIAAAEWYPVEIQVES